MSSQRCAYLMLALLATAACSSYATEEQHWDVSTAMERFAEMLSGLGEQNDDARTVAEAVANAPGNMSFLTAGVNRAGLAPVIQNPDFTATIFAPTNGAFETALVKLKISPKTLYGDKSALTNLLSTHVVNEKALSLGDLHDGLELDTVQGQKLTIKVDKVEGTRLVGGQDEAKVIAGDIHAGKCIIHIVDTVIVPPPPSS